MTLSWVQSGLFPVLCVMKDLDEVYLQSVLLLFANIEFLVVWLRAILQHTQAFLFFHS